MTPKLIKDFVLKKQRQEYQQKENIEVKQETSKVVRKQDKPVRSKRKDIGFSDDTGPTKKEKQEKYLTISALVNHPFFGNTPIEVNVTTIIEEFEKF